MGRFMSEKNIFSLISRYRTAIMGFAALWILIFHEWQQVFNGVPIVSAIESIIVRIGFCGVDIFLMLSGIGLTYSIKKGSIGQFYKRRVQRVFLPYLCVAIVYALIEKWSLLSFLTKVSGFDFYAKTIYSFLWFVPAILSLYLIFPVYYRLFIKSPKLVFTVSLIVWLSLSVLLRNTMRIDLYGFTNRIPIFIIGIFLGWISQNKTIIFTVRSWILVFISLILGLILSYLTNFNNLHLLVPVSNCCIPNILLSISLVFILSNLYEILNKSKFSKHIITFFSFLGGISFELYCVQEKLGEIITNYTEQYSVPIIVVNFAIILLSILSAYILKHLISMTHKVFTSKVRDNKKAT